MNNLSIVFATHTGSVHFIEPSDALSYLRDHAQNMGDHLYIMGDEKETFDPFCLFAFRFSFKNLFAFENWIKRAASIAESTPEIQVHVHPVANGLSNLYHDMLSKECNSLKRLHYHVNEQGFADILE